MRAIIITGAVSLLVAALAHALPPGSPVPHQFKFKGVLFGHPDNRVICEGRIPAGQFQKWFKKDYPVGGERVETPKDAAAIGALVLTDGEEVLIMPLYRWGSGRDTHFACQSAGVGRAPMFSVVEQPQETFFQVIKRKLAE